MRWRAVVSVTPAFQSLCSCFQSIFSHPHCALVISPSLLPFIFGLFKALFKSPLSLQFLYSMMKSYCDSTQISNNVLVLKIHTSHTATERHRYRAGIATVWNICRVNNWSPRLVQEGNFFFFMQISFITLPFTSIRLILTEIRFGVRAESVWRVTCGRKRENKVYVPHVYLTTI